MNGRTRTPRRWSAAHHLRGRLSARRRRRRTRRGHHRVKFQSDCLLEDAHDLAGRCRTAMSPRPYRLGKREEAVGQSRRRILDAARELLGVAAAYPGFTVDAVARRADVARATVYYQFGSKTGLLEAVCDDLAEAGGMAGLADVFTSPDAEAAIRGFITAFAGFWAADRVVMRRLRALAALDPDVGTVVAARDQR